MEATLEAASKPLAKEQHLNQQSHHHHQENSHCGSCHRVDLPLSYSQFISFQLLLSSVTGWLMYGLGKWREAALDKCLQIQWLSWTPQVFWFVSLDDHTTVPDQITSCTELFQDRAGWRESGLTYTHQRGADSPTAVLDALFSSPTIPVFTALDATDGWWAEICG